MTASAPCSSSPRSRAILSVRNLHLAIAGRRRHTPNTACPQERLTLLANEPINDPTIFSLETLQTTHAVHLLRPFHGGGRREAVRRPKCCAFDSGFITFEKGWESIRDDDRDLLWEHLVLDTLRVRYPDEEIFYWQDKSRREVDFVIRRAEGRVDVVECKMNPDRLDTAAIEAFRSLYPEGENYVVSPAVKTLYRIRRGDRVFTVCTTKDL